MENRQLAKSRPSDSEFPIMMTKQTLGDYLGKSEKVVNELLRNTRLSEAVFQLKGSDPSYLRPIVDKVIPNLKG